MTGLANPSHPGPIIRGEVLPAFGLNATQAAKALHVARPGFTNMLNGKRALSHRMAILVEKAFGVDASMMTQAQNAYDMAKVRRKRLTPSKPSD